MVDAPDSPSPWRITVDRFDLDGDDVTAIVDAQDEIVAHVGEFLMAATPVHPATARRIVACVNACRHLPTDMLEMDVIKQAYIEPDTVVPA